jgi:hypothetical protein
VIHLFEADYNLSLKMLWGHHEWNTKVKITIALANNMTRFA